MWDSGLSTVIGSSCDENAKDSKGKKHIWKKTLCVFCATVVVDGQFSSALTPNCHSQMSDAPNAVCLNSWLEVRLSCSSFWPLTWPLECRSWPSHSVLYLLCWSLSKPRFFSCLSIFCADFQQVSSFWTCVRVSELITGRNSLLNSLSVSFPFILLFKAYSEVQSSSVASIHV